MALTHETSTPRRSQVRGDRYTGKDHCSRKRALELCERLRVYWKERGQDRHFVVVFEGTDVSSRGENIWGVREMNVKAPTYSAEYRAKIEKRNKHANRFHRPLTEEIIDRFDEIIYRTLRDEFAGITREMVFGRVKHYQVGFARRRCIQLCYQANLVSLPSLGKYFGRNHSTIMAALKGKKGKVTIRFAS